MVVPVLKKIISSGNDRESKAPPPPPAPVSSYASEDPYDSYDPEPEPEPEPAVASYSSPSPLKSSFSSSAAPQMSKNILSNDVLIKGSIKFSEELVLDGSVEGEVMSETGHLTVGENATVKGEVRTRAVIVFGKVDGNLTVTERCELKADAEIIGDITAGTLSIEEGAAFMGQSAVGAAAVAKATKNNNSGSGSSGSGSSGSSSSSSSNSPSSAATALSSKN